MKNLSKKQKVFFIGIYLFAILLLVLGVTSDLFKININNELFNIQMICFFILITALTESVTLCFNKMSFSTTYAVTLATYILFGPLEALMIIIGGFLLRVLKINNTTYKHLFNTPLYGTCFNCSMFVIAMILGHIGAYFTTSILPGPFKLMAIIVFSTIYFIVNKLVVAGLQYMHTNQNIWFWFRNDFGLVLINYVIMIPFAIILVKCFEHYSYWGIILIIFPVMLDRKSVV